jgi:hypothetical protein
MLHVHVVYIHVHTPVYYGCWFKSFSVDSGFEWISFTIIMTIYEKNLIFVKVEFDASWMSSTLELQ